MTQVLAVAASLLTLSLGTIAFSFKTIDVESGPLSVYGTAAQKGRPYLVHDGVDSFEPPSTRVGADDTWPRSINASGDIVGSCCLADGSAHGFVRRHHGKWTRLEVPGAEGATDAHGISAAGEIVGAYSDDGWNALHGARVQGDEGSPLAV